MTFSYKGVMFSYGNYDQEDEKLFRTFGPGILFTAPADIYVNNSCVYENSILFEYGLHLTSEQEEHLVSLLKDVFKPAYRWYSPLFQGPVTKSASRRTNPIMPAARNGEPARSFTSFAPASGKPTGF